MRKRLLIILVVCLLVCACLIAFSSCDEDNATTNLPGGETENSNADSETADPCANGHTEVIDSEKPATCLEKGLTEGKHCSVCNTVLVAQTETEIADHAYRAWVITTPVTCETKGVQLRSCSVCQAKQIQEIPALGHSYGAWEVRIPAGCETRGEACKTCANCKDSQTKEIPATGHCWGAWQEIKAPTESEKGLLRRDCANCDAHETEELDALVHNHQKWATITLEAVAPTCTESGLTAGKKCSGCGAILEEQQVIPAHGHSVDLTREPEHTPPTCDEKGINVWNCLICGVPAKTEFSEALGHRPPDVYTHANCIEEGFYTCTVCGKKQTVPATGHTAQTVTVSRNCITYGYLFSYCTNETCPLPIVTSVMVDQTSYDVTIQDSADVMNRVGVRLIGEPIIDREGGLDNDPSHIYRQDDMIVSEPTCTENGVRVYVCRFCHHQETVVDVPALGHDMIINTSVGENGVFAPDCTNEGYTAFKCTRCTYTEKQNVIEKADHRWEDGEVTPPTCMQDGYVLQTCTVCGMTRQGNLLPFESKDQYTMEEITLFHPNATMIGIAVEGSCEVEGLYRYYCSDCGAEPLVVQEGTGKGHQIPPGACFPKPTCTEGAYISYDCEKCSQHIEKSIPALGHSFVDHVCTKCGERES